MLSWTKSLAGELAPHGIRVNCVAPGWVFTEMAEEALQSDNGTIAAGIPLGRAEMSGPRNVLTICLGKSTYARCGIIVNVTPLEPEWEGHVTLEFSNTTPLPANSTAMTKVGVSGSLNSSQPKNTPNIGASSPNDAILETG